MKSHNSNFMLSSKCIFTKNPNPVFFFILVCVCVCVGGGGGGGGVQFLQFSYGHWYIDRMTMNPNQGFFFSFFFFFLAGGGGEGGRGGGQLRRKDRGSKAGVQGKERGRWESQSNSSYK